MEINFFAGIKIKLFLDRDKYNKFIIKHNHNITASDFTQGIATHLQNIINGESKFIIGIFLNDYRVCIHEASHIVTYLMQDLGIKDDEFRAYMVEYISEQLINKLAIIGEDNG